MKQTRSFFFLALCLAIAWTCWLAYMAATVSDPVVVSAPQLHFASIVIMGKVTPEGATAKVEIKKIYKDSIQQVRQKPLPEVLTIPWQESYPKSLDQVYLLALIPTLAQADGSSFQVAPVFKQENMKERQELVVYPMTDSVRIQTERILGAK